MPFRSFEEFWPHYVGEPRRSATRWIHFVGTTAAILCAIAAAIVLDPWLLLAAPVVAYGLAWIGHFFVAGDKPATFRHPLWSVRGDIRMYFLMWRGGMNEEIRRLTRE